MPKTSDYIRCVGKIDWDLRGMTAPGRIDPDLWVGATHNGGFANDLASSFLGTNGYLRQPDGNSGWLLHREERIYRLRVAGETKKFVLDPSINHGAFRPMQKSKTAQMREIVDGFVLASTRGKWGMPDMTVYEVDMPYIDWLRGKELCGHTRKDILLAGKGDYIGRAELIMEQFSSTAISVPLWTPRVSDVVGTVTGCARCGSTHTDLVLRKLAKPSAEYAYWACCPETGEPVLVASIGVVKLAPLQD